MDGHIINLLVYIQAKYLKRRWCEAIEKHRLSIIKGAIDLEEYLFLFQLYVCKLGFNFHELCTSLLGDTRLFLCFSPLFHIVVVFLKSSFSPQSLPLTVTFYDHVLYTKMMNFSPAILHNRGCEIYPLCMCTY